MGFGGFQCPDRRGNMGIKWVGSYVFVGFLAVLFYLPRLAWGRVSDHLFRWTRLAHMTDPALDQLEGQPRTSRDQVGLRTAKNTMFLSGIAFQGSQRSSFSSRLSLFY